MLLILILTGLVGLLAGGLVNVLADDLPLRRPPRLPRYVSDEKKRSIHLPPPEDGTPLALVDDAKRPIAAWLGITAFLLGKRTSPEGVQLSWRYPITELLTSFMMILTIIATRNNADVNTLQLLIWLVYMAIFVLITVIDIEHKLILFVVIIPSSAFAILDAILTPTTHPPSLTDALIGGVAGFAVFFLMYNGGFLFTYILGKMRGEDIDEIAFGYGDVMMATLSGLILGWQALIFAMFITVFLGAFGAIIYLLSRSLMGSKYSAFTAIPYGPYIVLGTVIMLLFREEVASLLSSTP